MYVYIKLIHSVVQQKLTQHCKAIIFQKKKRERRKPPNTNNKVRKQMCAQSLSKSSTTRSESG